MGFLLEGWFWVILPGHAGARESSRGKPECRIPSLEQAQARTTDIKILTGTVSLESVLLCLELSLKMSV